MKILCICSRGNVRSVNMAYLLKDRHGHEAIAMGYNAANQELRQMLMQWAEKIIVLDRGALESIHANGCHWSKVLPYIVALEQSGLDCAYKPTELAAYENWLKSQGLTLEKPAAFWKKT